MFLKQEDQIDEPEVLVWLGTLLEAINASLSAGETLATLRERSGLIVGPGIYSFAHKSIAEYLVAETILQGDQQDSSGRRMDRFSLFEHRDDDRWNTVTFLWAGLAPVADVESFIDESIEAKALPLACGILDDQYDRIPRGIQERLIKNIVFHNDDLNALLGNKESNTHWIVSYPTSHNRGSFPRHRFSIPTFGLRCLTPDAEFQDLVLRAVHDDVLRWSDYDSTTGPLRDLLWMAFATHAKNLQQWKACLAAASPVHDTAPWLFWVVEYLIRNGAVDSRIDLNEALSVFKACRPSFKGLVPLALISAALGILLEQREERRLLSRDSVSVIMRALALCEEGESVQDFTEGTRDWVLGSGRKIDDEIGDLFTFFLEQMTWATQEGLIEKDDAYERAIGFVRDLQVKRNDLFPRNPKKKRLQ